MDSFKHDIQIRPTLVVSALIFASLLLAANDWKGVRGASQAPRAAYEHEGGFTRLAAGIQGRIQMLRQCEREMLANATNLERTAGFARKRDEARKGIDGLLLEAGTAASNGAERRRLEQFAAMAHGADIRFERVRAAIAEKQGPLPWMARSE